MAYKVVITEDAQADLDRFINYLLFEKNSEQAVSNVLEDFKATVDTLSLVAGSLKYCDNWKLKKTVTEELILCHINILCSIV